MRIGDGQVKNELWPTLRTPEILRIRHRGLEEGKENKTQTKQKTRYGGHQRNVFRLGEDPKVNGEMS